MSNRASTLVIYGGSGSAKTTSLGWLARHVHRTTGKITRLVSADGGGWDPIQDCIDDGIIEAWHVGSLNDPTATMRKLSRFEWPVVENGKLVMRPTSAEQREKIGAYAIEGLTSVGDAVMRSLRSRGSKLGESPNYSYAEGTETFYGSNQSYYGFIQDVLYEFVTSFSQLPVPYVAWTAMEAKGEDDQRVPIYGPAIAGKKAVSKAPQWFGDCLHHDIITVEETGKDGKPVIDVKTKAKVLKTEIRAYFTNHPDPATGIVYPAKIRVPAARLAELRADKKFENGYFEPSLSGGLDWLLEIEERLRKGGNTK